MTADKDALLPCPFCGGNAEIERHGTIRQSMIIVCEDCGCRVESGDVFGMTLNSNLKWNRRARVTAAKESEQTHVRVPMDKLTISDCYRFGIDISSIRSTATGKEGGGLKRRIVCAANLAPDGTVTLQVRHCAPSDHRQGFIDNQGNWLTREQAYVVAKEAGQIIRRVGGDEGKLFSENIY